MYQTLKKYGSYILVKVTGVIHVLSSSKCVLNECLQVLYYNIIILLVPRNGIYLDWWLEIYLD